jgi:uncharacterized membrane protein
MRAVWMGVAFAAALSGCAFGDATLDELDPEAAPATPTWSADIAPMMDWHCTKCHSKDSILGASEGIELDTCAQVKAELDDVAETVFDAENMPPGGALRLASWEELTLRRWIDQGATCD